MKSVQNSDTVFQAQVYYMPDINPADAITLHGRSNIIGQANFAALKQMESVMIAMGPTQATMHGIFNASHPQVGTYATNPSRLMSPPAAQDPMP